MADGRYRWWVTPNPTVGEPGAAYDVERCPDGALMAWFSRSRDRDVSDLIRTPPDVIYSPSGWLAYARIPGANRD